MNDGFAFADIGQELVPQPFSFAGSLYEAGNVHNFYNRRKDPLRIN